MLLFATPDACGPRLSVTYRDCFQFDKHPRGLTPIFYLSSPFLHNCRRVLLATKPYDRFIHIYNSDWRLWLAGMHDWSIGLSRKEVLHHARIARRLIDIRIAAVLHTIRRSEYRLYFVLPAVLISLQKPETAVQNVIRSCYRLCSLLEISPIRHPVRSEIPT